MALAREPGADRSGSATVRIFRFLPRHRPPLADEERRFRTELAAALRIAGGIGCAFGLTWESGRTGGALRELADPVAAAWARHALLPAYGLGHWSARAPVARELPPARRFLALAGPAALPLPFAVDRPPWSETVLLGLAAAPSGVLLEWRASPAGWTRPVGAPVLRAREPWPETPRERPAPPPALERGLRDRAEERRQGLPWRLTGTLRAAGSVAPGSVERVAGLVAAAARLEGGNALRFVRPLPGLRRSAPAMLFSEAEVMGLLPSPWTRAAAGPDGPRPPDSLALGRGDDGRPVRLPVDPDQGRHLVILGETGMGKSSLLLRLAAQAARRGAVILLDPVGDTGRRFLGALDRGAAGRATWISPTESPIGVNALGRIRPESGAAGARGERSLHELVQGLRRVRAQRYLDGGFWGPRIEEVLGRTLTVASGLPGGTLVEAHALLADAEEVPLEAPEELRPEVRALRTLARERPEEVAGSRRVLGEIAHNDVLRRLLCEARPRFELASAVAPGAVTVITADAPSVGESTARYLLSVDLALLWAELLARPTPSKVFLALEEAQWYAHESLLELLRLGRRGNIHVWAATQSLRSLGEELREAVLTNASDLAIFRGDPEEAREFARWSPELTVERLLALPRGHAAVLVGKGVDLSWTVTEPLPPEGTEAGVRERIRDRSRAQFLAAEAARAAPGPEVAAAAAPEGGRPVPPAAAATRAALLAMAAYARDPAGPVALHRLRSELGLSDADLRAIGSRLRRERLLQRRIDGADGPGWELAAAGWDRLIDPPASTAEVRTAAAAAARLRGGPGTPAPEGEAAGPAAASEGKLH